MTVFLSSVCDMLFEQKIRAEEISQDQQLLEMKFSANGLDKKVS